MKIKNLEEWLKSIDDKTKLEIKEFLTDFVNNYPDNTLLRGSGKTETLKKILIGAKIIELLTTISDAEKIDCTCDKLAILKGGMPFCMCARSDAIQQSGLELGAYLKELRKELK